MKWGRSWIEDEQEVGRTAIVERGEEAEFRMARVEEG
jgi:hypothetical protein